MLTLSHPVQLYPRIFGATFLKRLVKCATEIESFQVPDDAGSGSFPGRAVLELGIPEHPRHSRVGVIFSAAESEVGWARARRSRQLRRARLWSRLGCRGPVLGPSSRVVWLASSPYACLPYFIEASAVKSRQPRKSGPIATGVSHGRLRCKNRCDNSRTTNPPPPPGGQTVRQCASASTRGVYLAHGDDV